jgi:hypothetical protein
MKELIVVYTLTQYIYYVTQMKITKVKNKKFWKELICLLSLHYLKMSFALKPASAPT